ncbi:MAG: Glyoxalase/bleomycin resistance protein/dioxygenase [Flavipsychrobacter sp.]|nr:Glyoxalase/bleomycin resistance protein/dioxygenase [Flavipsychrobacter sp.]
MADPKRVTALGGVFVKCEDPAAVRNWYAQHLGFSTDNYGTSFEWRHADNPEQKGYSVWSTFPKDTKYFEPSGKEFMLNLRVKNLEWLLGELKKEGIDQLGEMQVYEYGKFAHIMDPEGNKIELWEANDVEFGQMASSAITK